MDSEMSAEKVPLTEAFPIPVGVLPWPLKKESRFLWANQAAAALYGYSQEEFRALTWADLTTDTADVQAALSNLPAGETTVFRTRFVSRTGETFSAEVIAAHWPFQENDALWLAIGKPQADNTQWRCVLFDSPAFKAWPDPVVVLRWPEGKLLLVNDAAARRFALTVGENLRQSVLVSLDDMMTTVTSSCLPCGRCVHSNT